MKIIQALGWYYPESVGGTEVYVAGLSHRLRSLGHEVFVAAPDSKHERERLYEHDGIPVYRYPIPKAPTRAECQGSMVVRGAERFHAWLERKKPDIVHIHTFVTGLGLQEVKAAKTTGARVIVTTHSSSLGYICQRGTMMHWGKTPCDGVCFPSKCAACELQHRGLFKPIAQVVGMIPPAASRVMGTLHGKLGTALGMSDLIARNKVMQREMVATADKFVLLTQWALNTATVNDAPSEKLAINRLGIAHGKVLKKPGPLNRPTTCPIIVGYLGRFDTIKGVHDLAKAVAGLPDHVLVRVEFRGPVRSDLEKTVVNELKGILRGDQRVTFAPAIPESDVLKVLAGYDVLCCPSVCAEGGPTVAIEAQAVGTPVIGTRIGGLVELINDGVNGRLFPPRDWQALGMVLRDIVADPAVTVDRWREALPTVRTMDEVLLDYLALYGPS